jgi:predicted short-subunit dehydrogenase-like oxidoreductase (DUF2520 family)
MATISLSRHLRGRTCRAHLTIIHSTGISTFMWELERDMSSHDLNRARCAIVGAGRLGRALTGALRDAGIAVEGPLGRGADGAGADVVLLCVPDGAIAAAAAAIAPGPIVGHCSGATTLAPLAPHEAFSLHPLMTVPAEGPAQLAGAHAAVAGSSERAKALATALADRIGLAAMPVADEDRVAYHAAASLASNFLVTLEAAAEQLAAGAGVERAALVPLVRATVENWAALGPEQALTGPIARGDEATVARQREEIAERAPQLLALFDTLAQSTRALAAAARAEATA